MFGLADIVAPARASLIDIADGEVLRPTGHDLRNEELLDRRGRFKVKRRTEALKV